MRRFWDRDRMTQRNFFLPREGHLAVSLYLSDLMTFCCILTEELDLPQCEASSIQTSV